MKGLLYSIEFAGMHDKTEEAMCKLLTSLFRRWNFDYIKSSKTFLYYGNLSFVITIDQMRAGFQRIYDMMGDISIDVPQVHSLHKK